MFWSPGYGVSDDHESLVNEMRNDPLKTLLPDFVIELITPPWKRPYSAEMLPVETLVSWIASSMKRLRAWPRRFSLMTTPLTRLRFSYDSAPDTMMLPPGPLSLTPGASRVAACSVRPRGSLSTRSDLYVLATVAVWAISVAATPVTCTVSVRVASASFTSSGMVAAISTCTVRWPVWNPSSSNERVYIPGGRNGMM